MTANAEFGMRNAEWNMWNDVCFRIPHSHFRILIGDLQ